MDLHEDFYQTLEQNKGLPPTSISSTTMLYNRAIHDTQAVLLENDDLK